MDKSLISVKSLHYKELPSRLVGLTFHGLDVLILSLLKATGTTTDKKWKERKNKHFSLLFRGYKH